MKATVLIPNYNNEKYLVACLDSVCNQSYKNFEILIVDDGSTDNSVDIINNYPDSRINLILKDSNTGIIETLNIGLKAISSQFIIRMDADDLMNSTRVEKLINFMESNPDIGVCGSGLQQFGISDEKIFYESDPDQNKANLVFNHTIGHATVIYRNKTLKKNSIKYSKGYSYIEDYKIFYDLSKVTSITSIDEILYMYRREEYNNYKNIDIKKNGYLKIYNSILTELKIEASEENCLIHYQIGTNINFNYSYTKYNNHLKSILKQNKKLQVFPETELITIIKNKNLLILFKMIDLNKISILKGLSLLFTNPKIGYYFLKSKI